IIMSIPIGFATRGVLTPCVYKMFPCTAIAGPGHLCSSTIFVLDIGGFMEDSRVPRGPRGEKRPADVIGAAIMVAKIATGEIEDTRGKVPNRAKGGRAGG